ncbi:MAG TPA: hypothetical protein VFX61_12990 [Micromonosporaceae bacterium]|nr:hypothetical protein [Micromonosporaceae bacterium]
MAPYGTEALWTLGREMASEAQDEQHSFYTGPTGDTGSSGAAWDGGGR